eukprot:6181199-Pleurochrysis_carterae.AAC.2
MAATCMLVISTASALSLLHARSLPPLCGPEPIECATALASERACVRACRLALSHRCAHTLTWLAPLGSGQHGRRFEHSRSTGSRGDDREGGRDFTRERFGEGSGNGGREGGREGGGEGGGEGSGEGGGEGIRA